MYEIAQILNNNVVIIWDHGRQKAIAMGKGIAFQKKKGDFIAKKDIHNLFVLRNEQSEQNFSALLKDVPIDFITTSYEIIEHGKLKYRFPVQEYIYATLTDHIYFSYQRIMNHEYVTSMLPDLSEQYPVEYQIARDALIIIKNKLAIIMPAGEVANIAYHFINAKGITTQGRSSKLSVIKDTLTEISQFLQAQDISRDEDGNLYDRLMIHIKYAIDREPEELSSDDLAEHFREKLISQYPQAYQIAGQIFNIITSKASIILSSNEQVYLTIHLQRLLQRKQEKR